MGKRDALSPKSNKTIKFPDTATLFITLKCNYKCKYCYLPNFKNKTKINLKILRRLKELKIKRISILGGEPFLVKKELIETIKYCLKNNIKISSVSTNGSVIDKDILEILNKYQIPLQVSLDATNYKTYLKLRGNRNFFTILSNIKKIKKEGCNVLLSMVLTNQNYQEISKFVLLSKQLGIKTISLGSFIPLGRGKIVRDWILNDKEISQAWDLICRIKKQINILGIEQDDCPALKKEVDILPNGDIYPCSLFFSFPEAKIGNIFDKVFILNDFSKWLLNKATDTNCKQCKLPSVCYKPCKAFLYSGSNKQKYHLKSKNNNE